MHTRAPAPAEANKQQSHSAQHPAQLLVEQQSAFEDHSPQAAQLTSLQAMMSASGPQLRTQAMQAKMNGSAQVQQMRTLQARMTDGDVAQREEVEEPLQAQMYGEAVQREEVATASEAPKPNNTGLPDNLKPGIESLSGMNMDHVKVHYNSSQPAQLNAHAYAQGSEIYVAPGQEQHVPHEAWHVVQQAQGRVKPTMQMKGGVPVNDDVDLETEADVMGARALGLAGATAQCATRQNQLQNSMPNNGNGATEIVQRFLIDANTFQSLEQIQQAGGAGDYLAHYSQIRVLVEEYNLGAAAAEVIARLKQLDTIKALVALCLQQIAIGEYPVENPATARKAHLDALNDSITQEKADVLAEKTQAKDVLAGPHGILRAGVAWQFFNTQAQWVDASVILQNAETINFTVTGTEEANYLFDFMLGGVKKGKIAKDLADFNAKFTPDDAALFPSGGEPVKENVLQTNLGDCYLQAALAGLAASDPGFIKGMLYDEGENVIVRLYKLPEREPQYISVKRSKAQNRDGEDIYNAGAMWVKMIQKAYAAGNFAGDLLGNRKRLSMHDIAGDLVGYTMGVLTGREIDSTDAAGAQEQEAAKEVAKFPWGFEVGTLWSYLEDDAAPPKPETVPGTEYLAALNLLNPLFAEDAAQIKTWAQFGDSHRDALDGFDTLAQFTVFFNDEDLDGTIVGIIMGWVRASGFYKGAVGSGIYSAGQIAAFDKVETALGQHKLLAVGTKKVLSEEDGQAVGGGGEPKYKGLAGGHAYTILNVRKNRTANPESDDVGNIYWIQLRNPWGKYGRSYAVDWAPVAIEEGNGVFWVELTDLAQNFKDIEII